jgi:hypothetical protein
MPLAPNLGGSEHATFSAHVAKGSLTGAMGTATRDTRYTSNSAACSQILLGCAFNVCVWFCAHTSSPRFGRSLFASLLAHGVRLTFVLGHAGVHGLDDITARILISKFDRGADGKFRVRSDRRVEDGGERVCLPGGGAIAAEDADGGTRRHLCSGGWLW